MESIDQRLINMNIGPARLALNVFLISLCCIIICSVFTRIRKMPLKELEIATKGTLLFCSLLTFFPIASISLSYLNGTSDTKKFTHEVTNISTENKQCLHCDSDVYLIVLDGYARYDVLRQSYGFDNSFFIENLLANNFQVFNEARSNYGWTFLSLSSTLNMNYIEELTKASVEPLKTSSFLPLIRNNKVSKILKNNGYKYIHMSSTYGPTLLNPYADEVYNCTAGLLKDDFVRVYIEGTFLVTLNSGAIDNIANCHLDNMNWLENLPKKKTKPKFVFSHFVLPHHPYLFDKDGRVLRDASLSDQFEFQKLLWADRAGYLGQLQFLNKKLNTIMSSILEHSEKPPFIIIMSDHGPQLVDSRGNKDQQFVNARSASLLAIHTPDDFQGLQISSSVNLFRVLFNRYLGGEYELLENVYSHSSYKKPFEYEKSQLAPPQKN